MTHLIFLRDDDSKRDVLLGGQLVEPPREFDLFTSSKAMSGDGRVQVGHRSKFRRISTDHLGEDTHHVYAQVVSLLYGSQT